MNQQINLYQPAFLPHTNRFAAPFMIRTAAIVLVAMSALYGFAALRVVGAEKELLIVTHQETEAIDRLEKLQPLISSVMGERSWSEQLDDALRELQERQAVLSLVQAATHSETQGFSRHLRALARQNIEGIWLTRIVLSADVEKTQLDGRAVRAELIPLFVQDLTADPPFASQRFNRFRIDSPLDPDEYALHFSMDTENRLASATGARP